MTRCWSIYCALPAFLSVAAPSVAIAAPQTQIQESIGFDQNIGDVVPAGLRFRDADGRDVAFGDLAKGRPTVLELAWFSCPNLCPVTLGNLAGALAEIPFEPGADINVLVVSIDPREGPATARETRRDLRVRYGDGGISAWHFLTGDGDQIHRLAEAVGFRYAYDEKQDQYAHPAGLVLLDGQGRISRYLFGLNLASRDLKLGLVDAGRGKLGSVIDQIVLRCHSYDPANGQYTFAVMTVIRVACVFTVLLMAGFIGWRLVGGRRSRSTSGRESVR